MSGALTLPPIHHLLRPRQIEVLGTVISCSPRSPRPFIDAATVLVPLFFVAGLGWSWVGNLSITTLQMQTAPHLRARALALYIIAFQGSMAVGGALWGRLAESIGLRLSLEVAAGGLLLAILISRRLLWPAAAHDSSESPASPH